MNEHYKHEIVRTADLIPYVNNSRTHSDEQVSQICSSIKEFGFTSPVLIDDEGGLIAGHGRVMAAKKLGLDDVPAIILSGLTEAQKKAYVIADNQLPLNAGWDLEKLKLEIENLSELDFDLDLLGFEDDFLSDLLEEDPEEGLTDEDEVPEPPEAPVSVLGDIWQLGDHRLMCGDSTSIDAVEKLMDGRLADLLLTDPPYNVAYEGKTKDSLTIQNDSMSDEDFREFLTGAMLSAFTVMKEGACYYVWHVDFEAYNFIYAVKEAGFKFSQCVIWNKNTMVMGRKDYHAKYEPCLYGWKLGAAHLWNSDRKQVSVIDFDKPQANKLHPTMKPVGLFEYQLQNNTKGQDIVLDLFGGSGTTMIACEKTNRQARLMELDPKYCDVIIKRWQEYTGKQAIHIESGKTYEELKLERES